LVKTGKEREAGAGAQHPPQGQDQLPRPSRTNRPNSTSLFSLICGDVVGLGCSSDASNPHQETYDRDIQDKDYDKAKDGMALLLTIF
jgi:hypothetical protein